MPPPIETTLDPARDPAEATSPPAAATATGEDAYRAYLGRRHFGSLDGIRSFCILAVVWHHIPKAASLPLVAHRGFLGVDMFFLLSGFLIVTLLLRERRRTGGIHLPNFYARRTLRIFPIYYLLLAAVSFAYLAVKPGSASAAAWFAGLPYLLTYTLNWVHASVGNLFVAWSLAAEEQFYLVWPAAEKYLKPRWTPAVLLAVIGVNQLLNFRLIDPVVVAIYGTYPRLEILQTTFTPIALGALLAHILDRRGGFEAMRRLVGGRWAFVAPAAALAALLVLAPPDIAGWPRLGIQLAMMLLLASVVVREDHAARPVLSWGPIARIGLISYGMYLYHMFAMQAVLMVLGRLKVDATWVVFAACALATIAVAEVSFRLIESPLLQLKGRFGGVKGARPTA